MQTAAGESAERAALIELIEIAMIYKFLEPGLEEFAKMLGVATDASQTRIHQKGRAEC